MKMEYVKKFNSLKDEIDKKANGEEEAPKLLEKKDDGANHCLICYEDFDKDTMYCRDVNSQCLVCKTLLYKLSY